jgi:hypothetical protein
MWSQLGALLCGMMISGCALGQLRGDVSPEAATVRTVSAAEYRDHLESLREAVEACRKNPAACDAKKVGDDERVEGAGFQTRWSWLREVLSGARDATESDREKQLQQAAARLNEDVVFASNVAFQTTDSFSRARRQADDVLARLEFRTVTEESYLQRQMASSGNGWQSCSAECRGSESVRHGWFR